GGPVPTCVEAFTATASELVDRLKQLQDSEALLRLTFGWCKILAESNESRQRYFEQRCEQALALAKQVSDSSLDPQWDSVCKERSEKEVKRLRKAAQRIVTDRKRWWGFLDPRTRCSRNALADDRTISMDDGQEAAARLLSHLKAKNAREELARINQDLAPGLRPKTVEAQLKFPSMAKESLTLACWLRQMQVASDWT